MRTLLITALAWTATAHAFDVPKNALHEIQTCKTVTHGMIYDPPAIERGTIAPETQMFADRYTWSEGNVEVVVTKGTLNGDGAAQTETMVRRETSRLGDVENETLEMTVRSTTNGSTDSLTSYERNEYKIDGESKTLQSRVLDAWNEVKVNETVLTHPTARGRIVTTTLVGPITQKLSDVTGQYATIQSQVRTCTIDRAGQA